VLVAARVSDVAKVTTLTSLSSLSSCKLSFQIVGLKISLPNFLIKSPDRIFIWYLGKFLPMPSHYVALFTIHIYICVCVCVCVYIPPF
jgi:hypothetical protein